MLKKTMVVISVMGILAGAGFAGEEPGTVSVDEIVKKSNHMALYQGTDAKGKVGMVITDKQGRTRKREFTMLRRDDGGSDADQKYFVFFVEPADVRKMVFMVHKHAAPGKEDDRWLYLPGLDLVKRIAAGDKRTSFAGSDFLYEDISGRSITEDAHELIRTTEAHHVLKNVPRHPETVEFAYYLAYIDKKSFMPVKMEFFKKPDRLYRVIEVQKLENIKAVENGRAVTYPTVTKTVARDLDTGSRTEMVFSHVNYNMGLKEKLFSERYLRRAPREATR
ncbi:MAG TPA: outer membrane lipoprotein-sorting protein [Geobacteraceae bacterium]|nr:outer membrane lipoprotein-sorting protein [Geobacteraceae bacterium]